MEFKGTPGPWVAVFNNVYWEIRPQNRQETDPYTIGDVCASDPENPGSGLQEANARLIAAAPRMFYAGFALLKALQSGKRITFEEESELEAALMQALGQNNGQ